MTDYAVLLVAVLALLAAAWLAVEHVSNRRLAVRSRVVLNLHGGQALTGVLWHRRGRHLVLRNAEVVEPGSSRAVPMDGETIVDRDQVAFVQRLGV